MNQTGLPIIGERESSGGVSEAKTYRSSSHVDGHLASRAAKYLGLLTPKWKGEDPRERRKKVLHRSPYCGENIT